MNCKPHDVAMVVRKLDDRFFAGHEMPLGAIVTVVSQVIGIMPTLSGLEILMPSWILDAPTRCACCGEPLPVLPDEVLKPLPPPDDVLVHDTVNELPVLDGQKVTEILEFARSLEDL